MLKELKQKQFYKESVHKTLHSQHSGKIGKLRRILLIIKTYRIITPTHIKSYTYGTRLIIHNRKSEKYIYFFNLKYLKY